MRSLIFTSLFIAITVFNAATAQTIEEQMTRARPSCTDVFINAVDVFPKLYRAKAFDSMHTAINIWKDVCGNNDQVIVTTLMLSMQQRTFNIDSISAVTIEVLDNYARLFAFYKKYPSPYYKNQAPFYNFISIWAKLLMEERPLDENQRFICSVFTGNITAPVNEIKNNAAMYPALLAVVKQKEKQQRMGLRGNVALLVGSWIPNGDLTILGNHPSMGFQFGSRHNNRELNLTIQFRFLKSVHNYLIQRNNVVYQSNHYFGGCIGFDYTWYLLSTSKNDLGLFTGIGFDGFDVANSTDKKLRPSSINAFNAYGGLRYNFYLNPTLYLGIQGRYNVINYCNGGGSGLQGNAISLDLIFGGYNMRMR